MHFSFIFNRLFSLLKKPQKVAPAVKTAIQALGKRINRVTDLPQGKVEIPPLTKATVFPVPVVVCGTTVNGRPTFNTLGNFGLITPSHPNPIIYISSVKKHYTNIGIKKNGYFSVNIPSRAVMAEVDYLGVVSGHTTDKSKVMTVFYGRQSDTPCLAECPLNYVCKVIQHMEIGDKDLFIGEIVESFVSSEFLSQKGIDIERIEPLLYTADGYYRILGAPAGKAFNVYNTYSAK